VAPTISRGVTVVYANRNWATSITGSTAAWLRTGNWTLADGRIFSDRRSGRARMSAWWAKPCAASCSAPEPGRRRIRVKQFSCDIIGLLASKGQSSMGMDQDDVVLMPLHTVQRRLTGNQDVNTILISVKDGASMAQGRRR
jgi:putative ABC transport system permease protein